MSKAELRPIHLWGKIHFKTSILFYHICWACLFKPAQSIVVHWQSHNVWTSFSNVASVTFLTLHLFKQLYICIVGEWGCSILAWSTSGFVKPRSNMTISHSAPRYWASLLMSRSFSLRVLVLCGIVEIQLASSENKNPLITDVYFQSNHKLPAEMEDEKIYPL